MLASNSVQEAADLALIAQAASLETRVPFLHFFDGFRTSHEVARIIPPMSEQMCGPDRHDELVPRPAIAPCSTPDRPVLRGAAHNPDVCFQVRETANPFYRACPEIVQNAMDKFAQVAAVRTTSSTISAPPMPSASSS